ncbi:MAG: pyridoxamine 5'-phosphate oxidase family protein [Actinomycetota bacterium]
MKNFLELAQTPAIHAVQEQKGALGIYDTAPTPLDGLDEHEAAFIQAADSFYMATVNEDGWPYVQHKGGAPGFVKVLGPATIGWTERSGNRQYLGAGNVAANGRVALIFVDYARRMRLKVLGRARHVTDLTPGLADDLNPEGHRADGGFVIEVEATAWNCPKHITPRITVDQARELVAGLEARIAELEAQLATQATDA